MEWQLMESVEQVKELAVLDPMMGVLQKLLYVQSGDIVSVLHTNLEILNVVLVLMKVPRERELQVEVESVEQVKEPAVQDPMMAVLQRLLYVQNGDIANVLHTNLEVLNVVLASSQRGKEELGGEGEQAEKERQARKDGLE